MECGRKRVSTVVNHNKIASATSKRKVGAMTSGERGTNVSLGTVSGNSVLPMFVFPRKKLRVTVLVLECMEVGKASGWVIDEEFF